RLTQVLSREPQDREELVELLRDAAKRKVLNTEALAMMEGALQVAEMQVREIMIPRAQMVVVAQHDSPKELLPIIIESQHSRFPVIGENRDEVVGILLAKDLLRFNFAGQEKFDMSQILRPAVFIPESKRLNVLLREFRLTRNHMAIVVDEYGGVAGVVTIEDVLEQIVGEIEDEFDISEEESNIKRLSDSQYTVKALTPIQDFNEYFQAQFSDEAADTIGGLVLHKFGHLPKRGEITTIEGFEFKVLHADNRRVRLLRVTVPNKSQEQI
ncbi:MAG: transporter associated domain-containing protein, partial [Gammaproteobacteria bacterium]